MLFNFVRRDSQTNDYSYFQLEGATPLEALRAYYTEDEYYVEETSYNSFTVDWDYGGTGYVSVHSPESTKLIIYKSSIIIGEVPVFDFAAGQFYPDEQYAEVVGYEICSEYEVEKTLKEIDEIEKYIVCDYFKTNSKGLDIYVHDCDYYFVAKDNPYIYKDGKIRRLV